MGHKRAHQKILQSLAYTVLFSLEEILTTLLKARVYHDILNGNYLNPWPMTPWHWIKMHSNVKGRIYCQQNIRQKSVLHSHCFSFTGYDHTHRNVYVPPKFLLPFLFTQFFSISFAVRRLQNHPDVVPISSQSPTMVPLKIIAPKVFRKSDVTQASA